MKMLASLDAVGWERYRDEKLGIMKGHGHEIISHCCMVM
jgi:hypothetical protein